MIWLTWRQHRRQALFTAVALALMAAFVVPTGLAMRHAFAANGLAECVRLLGQGRGNQDAARCDLALHQFNNEFSTLSLFGILLLFLPLLVGLFWGAPLVAREVEHGTHRMIWTQGVSRRHWMLVKVGLVGAATLVASMIFGLGVSWWLEPLTQAGEDGRFQILIFDMQGIVPVGYTLFAVALGIFVGTIWPKVLPAMAATLAGFLVVRIALTALGRPRFLPPKTLTFPVRGPQFGVDAPRGSWVISTEVRDAAGKTLASHASIACPPDAQGPGAGCGTELGIGPGAYNWELYQPAARFWVFQTIETGIFLALAALLIYFALRRIRRFA